MNQDENLRYWDELAIKYGGGVDATSRSAVFKILEVYALSKLLRNNSLVLDLGCGNGLNIQALLKTFMDCRFVGVDYSTSMIHEASLRARAIDDYRVMDVRDLEFDDDFFDFVMSDRCLINILDVEGQKKAIGEAFRVLRPGGYFLCLENFRGGKDNSNKLRVAYGLVERKDADFNLFLNEKWLFPFLKHIGFRVVAIEDFGALHDIACYCQAPGIYGTEFNYESALVKNAVDATIKYRELYGHYPRLGSYGQNRLLVLYKPHEVNSNGSDGGETGRGRD